MAKLERIYRRTDAGCRASESNDASLPAEYRRILNLMIHNETHSDVVRTALRRYSDEDIFAWLADLENRGLVVSEPVTSKHDLDFTGNFSIAEIAAAHKRTPPGQS
jgi:hypothetical protein